ncbi:transposase [Streptomyces sp. NBC_00487]|uniref:transposase n=1 Tax=unclassified Streptomyces TaxID=2593676 RepID=UPI002E1905F3|nr:MULTISPECIES: transposase [unclassified Streptomyces]
MGGDLADVRVWASELDAVHGRFVHRFSRSEPRESVLAYMRGLIAPLQRKNGWTLAEEAGHAGPDRIQRMLNRIEWDADEVLDDVRRYVVDNLGDREAVLIVDDTGFLKKGTRSAGVQRQYSGTAGARISISARQRGVGGSLRYDFVSVGPRCRSCSAGQVRSDPAALR